MWRAPSAQALWFFFFFLPRGQVLGGGATRQHWIVLGLQTTSVVKWLRSLASVCFIITGEGFLGSAGLLTLFLGEGPMEVLTVPVRKGV